MINVAEDLSNKDGTTKAIGVMSGTCVSISLTHRYIMELLFFYECTTNKEIERRRLQRGRGEFAVECELMRLKKRGGRLCRSSN
jgi:hypothetical protein